MGVVTIMKQLFHVRIFSFCSSGENTLWTQNASSGDILLEGLGQNRKV